MNTLYVVVDANGEPLKGSVYSPHRGRVRAYTSETSAKRSASQTGGARVVPYGPEVAR